MSIRIIALASCTLIGVFVCLPAVATGVDSNDFTAYVDLASDYVRRGYSQTNANPALQLGLDFEHESGLFAGLRTSTVDFPSSGSFVDARELELNLYAGYGRDLGRGWAASASMVHYEYFGDESTIDWDYTELAAAVRFGRAALALAYSDSALGSGDRGLAVELTDGWRLPAALELEAGIGFFDLESPFLEDYVYWSLKLLRPIKRFSLSLGYYDTDDRGQAIWGELAEARVIVGTTYLIR